MKLVFATKNRGKLIELEQLLADLPIELVSALDLKLPDVVEDGDTFEQNASKKALEVSKATGLGALADDSGLEVDHLSGAPGVHSARYAGLPSDDQRNNQKLLRELEGVPDHQRTGRFRSVLALADTAGRLGQGTITTTGTCEGRILTAPRGTGGFGYDPLFFVPELGQTFARAGRGHQERPVASRASHAGHAATTCGLLPACKPQRFWVNLPPNAGCSAAW